MLKLRLHIILCFLVFLGLLLITPLSAYASHGDLDECAAENNCPEGWYCDGNQVWRDDADGNHSFWENCSRFGMTCKSIDPPPGYSQDADCFGGSVQPPQIAQICTDEYGDTHTSGSSWTCNVGEGYGTQYCDDGIITPDQCQIEVINTPLTATLSGAEGTYAVGEQLQYHAQATGNNLGQVSIYIANATADLENPSSWYNLTDSQCFGNSSCDADYTWTPDNSDAGHSFIIVVSAFSRDNVQCSGNRNSNPSFWSECDPGQGDMRRVSILVSDSTPPVPPEGNNQVCTPDQKIRDCIQSTEGGLAYGDEICNSEGTDSSCHVTGCHDDFGDHPVDIPWTGQCSGEGYITQYRCDSQGNISRIEVSSPSCVTQPICNPDDSWVEEEPKCANNQYISIRHNTCVQALAPQTIHHPEMGSCGFPPVVASINTDFEERQLTIGDQVSFVANISGLGNDKDYNCLWSINNSEFRDIGLRENNCHMTIKTSDGGFNVGNNSVAVKVIDESNNQRSESKSLAKSFTLIAPPRPKIISLITLNADSGEQLVNLEKGIEVGTPLKFIVNPEPNTNIQCHWQTNRQPYQLSQNCEFDFTVTEGTTIITIIAKDSSQQSSNPFIISINGENTGPPPGQAPSPGQGSPNQPDKPPPNIKLLITNPSPLITIKSNDEIIFSMTLESAAADPQCVLSVGEIVVAGLAATRSSETGLYHCVISHTFFTDNGEVHISLSARDAFGKSPNKDLSFTVTKPPNSCSNLTYSTGRNDKQLIYSCIDSETAGLTLPGTSKSLGSVMRCMMGQESTGGNVCAAGGCGEIGIFQYIADTWKRMGLNYGTDETRQGINDKVDGGSMVGSCWGVPGLDPTTSRCDVKEVRSYSQVFGSNRDGDAWNPYKQILVTKNALLADRVEEWTSWTKVCKFR